jgi:ABC-2 type transport system permease protein
MSEVAVALKPVRGASTVVVGFVAKRAIRITLIWGYVFGAVIASSAIGYLGIYKSLADREKFAASFSNNVGINALIGAPHHLETINGFTAWRSVGIMILIGSIWAILTASKTFRGEEAAGRTEMFLTGQTTAKWATAQTLLGLYLSLLPIFILVTVGMYAAGFYHDIGFTLHNGIYMGLTAVCAPAMLLTFGALASQIQPTRVRAAGMTAAFFGLSFLLRGIGNAVQSAHWLVNISPLGWVENLRPLTGSRPLWLLPIGFFTLIIGLAATHLASKRDLGESVLPDKDTALPKYGLLRNPLSLAWRLNRAQMAIWLMGLLVFATGFSSLSKAAADAIKASPGAEQSFARLGGADHVAATIFLGVVFLIGMTIMLLLVTATLNSLRSDEAEGYLDNLLVRPVSRSEWLGGRLVLVAGNIIAAGMALAIGSWLGSHLVHNGLTFNTMLQAGINAMAPVVLLAGGGVLLFGFVPRFTAIGLYAVVGWSFLMDMLGSLGNLNHWLLDTSILHHVALAPVVSPDWHAVFLFVCMGLALGTAGWLRFLRRDLQNE